MANPSVTVGAEDFRGPACESIRKARRGFCCCDLARQTAEHPCRPLLLVWPAMENLMRTEAWHGLHVQINHKGAADHNLFIAEK